MTETLVEHDERTTAVANAGYRWSYLVLSYGILAIVAYRSFSGGGQSWDLLGLVIAGGIVNAGFQMAHRVVYKRWVLLASVTLILAAILAAVMVAVR